jgi:hypothetical protein
MEEKENASFCMVKKADGGAEPFYFTFYWSE